jgi:acyl dehydratase
VHPGEAEVIPFETGQRFTADYHVDEAVHAAFVALSGDRNALHMDDAFACGKGFAGRVMHGNILCAFLSHAIGMRLPTPDVIIHTQEIAFVAPVYAGDRLVWEGTVEDVSPAVRAVTMKFRFRNQAGKIVARGRFQIGVLS